MLSHVKNIGIIFALTATSFSTTIHIPAMYPTIQAGINASEHYDEIIVAPGTYVENLHIDKILTLTSHFS